MQRFSQLCGYAGAISLGATTGRAFIMPATLPASVNHHATSNYGSLRGTASDAGSPSARRSNATPLLVGTALAATATVAACRRAGSASRTASGASRSARVVRQVVGEPSPANQFGFRGEPTKLSAENTKSFLDGIDIFIFDCDGVIWRGDSLIPGVDKTLEKLRQAGKKFFFVTNNSTKSRKGYKAKFDSLGLDVNPEEIFSSSFAAAAYMEQTKFKDTGKKVYVIGEKGIGEELDLVGVPWFGAEGDADKTAPLKPGGKVDHDADVGAVIVGFDRNVNYYKIQYAQLCINENPDCQFIATNLDEVTHLTDAQEWAGNGSMVGAMKGCTGKEPKLVGKPDPFMIKYLEEKYGIPSRKRICMVGDRLNTDIRFGVENGLQSCLVMSGVTKIEQLSDPSITFPDVYADDINDFFP